MLKGLYTSALGMTTQMNRMDAISNNIANVNTNAYKKDKVITQSFTEEFMKRINSNTETENKIISGGVSSVGRHSAGLFIDDLHTDFTVGSLKNTGGVYDLAITGEGFFAVSVTDNSGEEALRYTRDGAFTLNQDRVLVTKDGFPVQGSNGEITVPEGMAAISESGEIYVDGELVDTIRVVDFEDKSLLRKQGDNLYADSENAGIQDIAPSIASGTLELSNVNTVREMVELIEISRAYEANQRMVTIHDTTLAKAVTDIGRK